MYNILATKSHKIFEHTELPSLVKKFFFFLVFFFSINFINLKTELLHFRTLCKTASTIMNKLTLCCFTRPETYCLSTKRNYQIFYEKPGKTYLLVKKMQFNGVEKSNKPLFALSQQDFTWSEHLELSMRN